MSVMSVLVSSGGLPPRSSFSYIYSSNTADALLSVTALPGYRAGKSDITITVDSGIYLWATTTANPGLQLTGGTIGDTITLVNKGFIIGKGGNGALASNISTLSVGENGGPAVSIQFNTTINNQNGYIGGGGGGGGGFKNFFSNGGVNSGSNNGGAGGAGGGSGASSVTYSSNSAPPEYITAPIIGGAVGLQGSPLSSGSIIPGVSTVNYLNQTTEDFAAGGYPSAVGADAGGAGIIYAMKTTGQFTSTGGGGGIAGFTSAVNVASANWGSIDYYITGAGGGWGASGAYSSQNRVSLGVNYIAPPGVGGKGVVLNGKIVTWTGGIASSSRVYGAIA